MTDPKREKTQKPTCPNCNTDLTGSARNWGSKSEGDYIVYHCPTCAEYFGSNSGAMVYTPTWVERNA